MEEIRFFIVLIYIFLFISLSHSQVYEYSFTFTWNTTKSECTSKDCDSLPQIEKTNPTLGINSLSKRTSLSFKGPNNFQDNYQYSDYYSCFECSGYNPTQYFEDPMVGILGLSPQYYRCVGVNITVFGRFSCLGTPLFLIFTLQDVPINNFSIPMPSSPAKCECPGCTQKVEVQSYPSSRNKHGWVGYNYTGENSVGIINVQSQNFYISSMIVKLFYGLGPPNIITYSPSHGPTTGNTSITLEGVNFFNVKHLFCRFSIREHTEAAQISSLDSNGNIEFVCLTPPYSGDASIPISLWITVTDIEEKSLTVSDPITYYYYVEPNITSIDPKSGTIDGGTWVTITGTSFISFNITCSFGSQLVFGIFVSSEIVKCASPPGNGTVDLLLSMNGQQFTSAGKFSYSDNVDASDSGDFLTKTSVWVFFGSGFGIALILSVIFLLVKAGRKRIREKKERSLSINNDSILRNPLESPAPNQIRKKVQKDSSEEEETQSLLGKPSPFVVKIGLNTKNVTVVPGNFDMRELQIQQRIGRGTHGEVFRALWRGTEVAVKNLPQSQITQELMDDIIREAKIMRTLRHPNVLQFLGASMVPPNFCIIMEYMALGSLFNLLHDHRISLPWIRIKSMLLDAAKGMNYLHHSEPPIIHRDLKSQNLLVNDHWRVKVCDFGLCRILSETPDHATMTACGTPCWAAPEILRNQRYDKKADVYSFGVVLWECVSRRLPYAGMPPFQVVYAVANERRRPTIPETTSPEMTHLITECWSEYSKDRPAFDEIIQKLQSLSDGFIDDKTKQEMERLETVTQMLLVHKNQSERGEAMVPSPSSPDEFAIQDFNRRLRETPSEPSEVTQVLEPIEDQYEEPEIEIVP